MTELIHFTKMHGAGNDYIYVNTMEYPIPNPEACAIRWSKPHTGIGADGLVLIGASKVADFSMRIFNADGSEAMMCGNASRCIGKYVYDKGLTDKKTVTLETRSGIKELRLTTRRRTTSSPEEVSEVTVDMGCPVVSRVAVELEAGGQAYKGTIVSMGNPHFVVFVDDDPDEFRGDEELEGGDVLLPFLFREVDRHVEVLVGLVDEVEEGVAVALHHLLRRLADGKAEVVPLHHGVGDPPDPGIEFFRGIELPLDPVDLFFIAEVFDEFLVVGVVVLLFEGR